MLHSSSILHAPLKSSVLVHFHIPVRFVFSDRDHFCVVVKFEFELVVEVEVEDCAFGSGFDGAGFSMAVVSYAPRGILMVNIFDDAIVFS